jgi:hypothetical protein
MCNAWHSQIVRLAGLDEQRGLPRRGVFNRNPAMPSPGMGNPGSSLGQDFGLDAVGIWE